MIWRCPSCRGTLVSHPDSVQCSGCAESYPTVDGIPDLRFPIVRDAETLTDIADAREIVRKSSTATGEELVRAFFAVREGRDGWTARDTEQRTRQTLVMPDRIAGELGGWLQGVISRPNFLDIGCGLGGFLTAGAQTGRNGIGIDNRMTVLVIAKKLIESAGGTARLACASVEALPLADGSVGGVVMYDVVEHVLDLHSGLAEVSRITEAGGVLACSTPNRFSLAPEPHVHLLGVGWLPRRYQAAFVTMRSGRPYEGTRLLSSREFAGMVRRWTDFVVKINAPPPPQAEIDAASGVRKRLMELYATATAKRGFRPLFLTIGPFFQLIGTKRPTSRQILRKMGRNRSAEAE